MRVDVLYDSRILWNAIRTSIEGRRDRVEMVFPFPGIVLPRDVFGVHRLARRFITCGTKAFLSFAEERVKNFALSSLRLASSHVRARAHNIHI